MYYHFYYFFYGDPCINRTLPFVNGKGSSWCGLSFFSGQHGAVTLGLVSVLFFNGENAD